MEVCKQLAAGILAALVLVIITGCDSDGPRDEAATRPAAPTVSIGEATWRVEFAQTHAQRTKGLSGRESMSPRTGMLFIYQTATAPAFWMRGMKFPLDFVWIGGGCTVVDITSNVQSPVPGTPDSALPTYRPTAPSVYNLEINAGEAEEFGIQIGDHVRFSSFSANGGGC